MDSKRSPEFCKKIRQETGSHFHHNPKLFPKTNRRTNVRRSVLTKHTVIYYEAARDTIKIVALFDTRQDPRKLKI